MAAGLLLLFYTAYLLWGTSVYTRNVQNHLAKQLAERPLVTSAAPGKPATGPIGPARPTTPAKVGDPLFTIAIPKIGVRTIVVEGEASPTAEELKRGPAHFGSHPYPGEDGNVPISGHRTTFGAPFFRLDEVEAGDPIAIESGQARYRYTVSEKLVVEPSRVDVVESRGQNELTLTTCNPKFSASQRLIIHARYDGPEVITSAPPPQRVDAKTGKAKSLVPAPPPAVPTDVLALMGASVASMLLALGLSKRMRLAAIWAAVTVSAGIGLWTAVFPQVLRLMPANY